MVYEYQWAAETIGDTQDAKKLAPNPEQPGGGATAILVCHHPHGGEASHCRETGEGHMEHIVPFPPPDGTCSGVAITEGVTSFHNVAY